MALFGSIVRLVMGSAEPVSPRLLEYFPDLCRLQLRRGGLLPRLGGWCLGRRWVDGITVGRTVWLHPTVHASAELLLHELCHVYQFEQVRVFPLRYWWETLRKGYYHNKFEVAAREFAGLRLCGEYGPFPQSEV